MTKQGKFIGFSKETIRFFIELKKHNNKAWFDRNRRIYELHVMEPAKAFVVAMGERLKELSAGILAIPKANRSIFRINRDTRFSSDKSPYKTHLGLYFWEGTRPRMECSGFYFHLEPPNLLLGGGIYMFPRHSLEKYRQAVVHPESGARLAQALLTIKKTGELELGGRHYKRIPSGYDAEHPNAELLLHNGLYVGQTFPIPKELFSEKLVDYCWQRLKIIAPLHKWFVSLKIGFF